MFALSCVPLLAVGLLGYAWALPAYQDVVVAATDEVVGFLHPPMRLELNEAGWWNAFELHENGTETFFWGRPPENLHLFFMGLALLPALLLATPVAWARRIRLLGIGLALLFCSHVIAATALVHAQHHLRMVDPESVFWDWVKTNANAYGQVISFVLWALLTWDVWLRDRAQAEGEGGSAAADVEAPSRS